MPEDIPINILLKLIDQASDEFKKVNKEAVAEVQKLSGEQQKTTKETEKENTKSSEKIQDNAKKQKNSLQKVNDEIRLIRRNMVVFTIAVGFASVALNTFAATSAETRSALDEMALAGKNAASKVGELITQFS